MANTKGISFLFGIGQDLGVLPEKWETKDHYAERVILSAGAKWMLTAVHNEEERVSIESIKRITQDKIKSYLEIVDCQASLDVQSLVNGIYEALLSNGMFYHEQFNVRPVRNQVIPVGELSFVRGLLPEEKADFSGMVPYTSGKGDADLADAFMLWKRNAEETIRSAWLHSSLQDEQIAISEYLNVDHQMYQKYFDTRRHDQAEFTMGRIRKTDAHGVDYYLIRGNEIRRFTDDYINASVHEYVRLAIVNSQRKQNVIAKIGGNLVELEVGYLLPRPDARFLRFVSWPESLQSLTSSRFQFKVSLHPRMWPVVKNRLIFLGFAVEEQHE